MDGITEVEEWSRKVDIIELVAEAIDKRPAIPYLVSYSTCTISFTCIHGVHVHA